MEIPNTYTIYDTRISKDFKNITICGFKRRDVINAYQNSIINNKIEDSIRWLVELHATGLNNVIWNSLEMIYIKYIHINNPKLFFYILKRKKHYLNILKSYPTKHEIFTKNNQEIRNLYAELTSILTLTKKNNMFLPKSLPPIKNISFEKAEIKKRLISKNLDYILDFIHNSTTNNMKLALNEIINNLLYINGTFQNCLFWYLWLEKVESKLKTSNNTNTLIENITTNIQYLEHWTFILWNIILSFENKLDNHNLIFIKKLEEIYKSDFKISHINKKKYYFFIAFYIIKHDINWNIGLYNLNQNENIIIQINANINSMYYDIIKNIEINLSKESTSLLHKHYNQLYYNINNVNNLKLPSKIKDTSLDEDINKVLFTKHPEYHDIKRNNNIENKNMIKNNELVDKNKTQRDIINEKEEQINKRLEACTNFVTYIKKDKKENNKNKTVIDYYNNDKINNNEIKFKSIDFNINYNKNEIDDYNENNNIEYKNINYNKKI